MSSLEHRACQMDMQRDDITVGPSVGDDKVASSKPETVDNATILKPETVDNATILEPESADTGQATVDSVLPSNTTTANSSRLAHGLPNRGRPKVIDQHKWPVAALATPFGLDKVPTAVQWKNRRADEARLERTDAKPPVTTHPTILLSGKLADSHTTFEGKRDYGSISQTEIAKAAPTLFNKNSSLKVDDAYMHDISNPKYQDQRISKAHSPLP